MDATYVNTSAFSVTGDYTGWLVPGVRVKLTQTATAYSTIQSSTYSGGVTTVTLHEAVVQSTLTAVETGAATGGTNSLPAHVHNSKEGNGGTVGNNRMIMSYKDADEIYIGPGNYYIENNAGDTFMNFWHDTTLTYQFTSLGASEKQYLYADFSAIEAKSFWEVDATCFYNSTTAPTWDSDRRGWYNTDDLCIWGIVTDSSGQLYDFYQNRSEIFFNYEVENDIASGVDVDTTWIAMTANIPAFSSVAIIRYGLYRNSSSTASVKALVRGGGSSSTNGILVTQFVVTAEVYKAATNFKIFCDSSQQFETKLHVSGVELVYITTTGFILPVGM